MIRGEEQKGKIQNLPKFMEILQLTILMAGFFGLKRTW